MDSGTFVQIKENIVFSQEIINALYLLAYYENHDFVQKIKYNGAAFK